MAIYRIDRHYGALSREEIDAGGFRSMACLPSFPELRWLRSYYDPIASSSICLYETEQPAKIWEHAHAAQIPCDAVTEVLEFTPEMWAGIDPLILKARAATAIDATATTA
jgi:hypothetical protein